MANSVLVIFIDSFPYYYLNKTKYMPQFKSVSKLTPGFGYSINCQAEIFGGLKPDALGYFCEWTYDPKCSPFKKLDLIFKILHPARKLYYFDRILHRIIDKIYSKKNSSVKNIPFGYLSKMSRKGYDVFSKGFISPSLLNKNGIKVISTLNYMHLSPRLRDNIVYEKAISFIDKSSSDSLKLIISQTELDGIGHWYGVGSHKYDENIKLLDQRIFELQSKFFKRFKNGHLIVVSDHGMVNVIDGIKINMESIFGRPSNRTYFYFLEGTILRIWCFHSKLKKAIEDYFENLDFGSIINFEERKRFGVSKREFGDIIFLINEGFMFVPSFWGGKISKGMHGYHPYLESQKGIFLYLGKRNYYLKDEMDSLEVYNILKENLVEKHN